MKQKKGPAADIRGKGESEESITRKARAALYLRYSSSSQTEQSIEGQNTVCTDYCDSLGIKIVATYIDRAKSASHDTAKRTEFLRMIEDAKNGAFDTVVVYKLDRFARNRYDSAIFRRKLEDAGVKLISATEAISSTPEGIILEAVLEGVNEFYSADLKQKVERGINESIKKKKNLGGTTPLGYQVVNGHLEPDPKTAHIVQELFEMVADGRPYSEIISVFNSRGYKTASGNKFTRCSFYKIMHNKKYLGYYCYKDIEEPGGQEPLVSPELFEKVQRRLNMKGKKKSIADPYLLTGKLFCGHCSAPMVGESGKSATGKVHKYYKCAERKAGSCSKKPVRKNTIEDLVISETQSLLTGERLEELVSMVMEEIKTIETQSRIPAMMEELKEINAKLENAVNAVLAGNNSAVLAKMMASLEEDKRILEDAIEDQRIKERIQKLDAGQIEYYIRNLATIDPARLIDTFVERIYLYDDAESGEKNRRLKIIYRLSGEPETEVDCSENVSLSPPWKTNPNTDVTGLIINGNHLWFVIIRDLREI
ncbi:recombinase family protein [Faecalibaculum rodentium]|uniref:recombinase family protein n=3 Tax=Erysipelotrichaceae TaxID=128827 RepID=UPI002593BCE9|nr:recombinase family protein [Faecalibaculum rodentium]